MMELIKNATGKEVAVDAVRGKIEVTALDVPPSPRRACGVILDVAECEALEAALAAARTEATPTPEPAEAEPTDSVQCRAAVEGTVVATAGGRKLSIDKDREYIDIRIDANGLAVSDFVSLTMAAAAIIRDALSAFIGDEPAPAKSTAEVIAEHGNLQIIVIDGVAFHLYYEGTTARCIRVIKVTAQRIMLEWGGNPTEVQAATQAIDE